MIRSFRCEDTAMLHAGQCPRRFKNIQRVAERKLAMLDAAETLAFLRSPPGNQLEKLKGNRAGQWSIRINRQWRLCFQFRAGTAEQVGIVDYH